MMVPENVLNFLSQTVDSGENTLTHARHDWNGFIKIPFRNCGPNMILVYGDYEWKKAGT